MTVKNVFRGLVMVAAVALSATFALSGDTTLAILSAGLGVLWLAADAGISSRLGTLFFLGAMVLAVLASMNDAYNPLALLGACATLGAWDVSRFRARLDESPVRDRPAIEHQHLLLIAAVLCSGFLLALVPMFVHLSLPFVLICVVTLLAALALYQSIHLLRAE